MDVEGLFGLLSLGSLLWVDKGLLGLVLANHFLWVLGERISGWVLVLIVFETLINNLYKQ